MKSTLFWSAIGATAVATPDDGDKGHRPPRQHSFHLNPPGDGASPNMRPDSGLLSHQTAQMSSALEAIRLGNGWKESEDVVAAGRYLAAQRGTKDIGIVATARAARTRFSWCRRKIGRAHV